MELLKEIVKNIEEQGYPTEGAAAWALWTWSNYTRISIHFAKKTMEELGYVAFQGYPLKRLDEKTR